MVSKSSYSLELSKGYHTRGKKGILATNLLSDACPKIPMVVILQLGHVRKVLLVRD